jgi:AraC-like DNA-binding protein
LADHFGYSRSHFCRLFTQHVGVNPQAYMINARIALAMELLTQSDLPVTEIAAQAGYPDLFRFSRQFKQMTGHNPSAYRQLHSSSPFTE